MTFEYKYMGLLLTPKLWCVSRFVALLLQMCKHLWWSENKFQLLAKAKNRNYISGFMLPHWEVVKGGAKSGLLCQIWRDHMYAIWTQIHIFTVLDVFALHGSAATVLIDTLSLKCVTRYYSNLLKALNVTGLHCISMCHLGCGQTV